MSNRIGKGKEEEGRHMRDMKFSLLHILLLFSHLLVSDSTTLWTVAPLDSSVHGILQVSILEWIATPVSRGIFLTQGLNPGLLHCRQILY